MSHSQNLRKMARRASLLLGALVMSTAISVGSASAAECDPAVDENCVSVVVTNDQLPPSPPGYSVVFIDERQYSALLFLQALTAGLLLATFVWRSSGPLDLLGSKRW